MMLAGKGGGGTDAQTDRAAATVATACAYRTFPAHLLGGSHKGAELRRTRETDPGHQLNQDRPRRAGQPVARPYLPKVATDTYRRPSVFDITCRVSLLAKL